MEKGDEQVCAMKGLLLYGYAFYLNNERPNAREKNKCSMRENLNVQFV